MNAETIEYIKQTHKFKRTFWDYTDYIPYSLPAMLFVFGVLTLYKSTTDIVIDTVMAFSILISIPLFFLINRGLYRNIYFQSIPVISKIDIDTLAMKIKEYFQVEHIEIDKNVRVIRAYTKFSWGLDGSLQITIIIDDYDILINTKPNRNTLYNGFTVFAYNDNYRLLKWIIENQLK